MPDWMFVLFIAVWWFLLPEVSYELLCCFSNLCWDLTFCLFVFLGMVAPHKMRVSMFVGSSGGLPPNETTFAEVAQQHGYSTALIGKFTKTDSSKRVVLWVCFMLICTEDARCCPREPVICRWCQDVILQHYLVFCSQFPLIIHNWDGLCEFQGLIIRGGSNLLIHWGWRCRKWLGECASVHCMSRGKLCATFP